MINGLFFKMGSGRRRGRISDYLVAIGLCAAVALIVAKLDNGDPVLLEEAAAVADGDTLVVANERVRLRGIDAPEFNQQCDRNGAEYACGRMARDHLVDLIGRQTVSCSAAERDRYGRLLGNCLAGETDLNRTMVKDGWAVAFGNFEAEEKIARQSQRGIWAGDFDQPSSWRLAHRQQNEQGGEFFAMLYDWLRRLFGSETAPQTHEGDQDEAL